MKVRKVVVSSLLSIVTSVASLSTATSLVHAAMQPVAIEAAEKNATQETAITPRTTTQITYSNSWTTIASKSTSSASGLNRNVTVICYNYNEAQKNDIIMYGKNGNVVWQEDGAIGAGKQRTLWCGSDVYTVKIRLSGTFSNIPVVCNVQY